MTVKNISTRAQICGRSANCHGGHSAVEQASYIGRVKMYSEYDGHTYYPKYSEDLVHSEVMLPPNAPSEFTDPVRLWNSVELSEKQNNAQLARTFRVELPNELYKNAFLEPLFLHKQKLPNNHKVCLKNLFIFQNYCKEGSHRKYTNTRQYLIDFIENGNKMLLVEGNAGSGKSSLVSWMGYHYESRDKTSERVFGEKHLVIIRLRELDRALINGKSLIPALLAYMNVESIDKFAEIFPKAVIVLDGFDELCMIEKVTNQTQLIEDCIKRIRKRYLFRI